MFTEDEHLPPPKRLTATELKKSVERLSQNTRPQVELQPMVQPHVISKEAMDKRIHHLYDESLERRAKERAEVAKQMEDATNKDSTMTVTTIKKADEEALVQHLYDDTIALKKKTFDELLQTEHSHHQRSRKRQTKEEQDATSDRLYREGRERERDKRIELYEKYVIARRPAEAGRSKKAAPAASATDAASSAARPKVAAGASSPKAATAASSPKAEATTPAADVADEEVVPA